MIADRSSCPRVCVIGLDCATPQLFFDDMAHELPNLSALVRAGVSGSLRSVDPPITVPAWACAMTGTSPGQLGIYGFRNRCDHSYDGLSIATADSIGAPAVWDLIGRRGMRSLLVGVPPSYPPRPLEGWRVSCFLTPPNAAQTTWPAELADELADEVDRYIFDIPDFRNAGADRVLSEIHAMTRARFRVARRLARTKPWDFMMVCEIALDRLHHVFWQHWDPAHPLHVPGNRYEGAFAEYYRLLDTEVGDLLAVLPEDCIVIVMSDHGARPMLGGVCVNEWLLREGLLCLATPLAGPARFAEVDVDWPRTTAWADGGYYGRVFLNVKGREPTGTIAPQDYERVRSEVAAALEAMPGPDRVRLGTTVHRPESLYPVVRGVAPDLIVYFGDLGWRSVGTIGTGELFTLENDTGPDGANHDRDGVLVVRGLDGRLAGKVHGVPQAPQGGVAATPSTIEGARLVDVGPTLMNLYGVDVPDGVVGTSLI